MTLFLRLITVLSVLAAATATPITSANATATITATGTTLGDTCVISSAGDLKCWAADIHTPEYMQSGFKVTHIPKDLGKITQYSSTSYFACAITVAGFVKCWGHTYVGITGNPVPADIGKVTQISAGNDITCAVTISGKPKCWGLVTEAGVYGYKLASYPVPSDVGLVTQMSVSNGIICALKVSGKIRCWGNLYFGENNVPFDLEKSVQISTGEDGVCSLSVTGVVTCWGGCTFGYVGNEPCWWASATPSDLGQVVQISMSQYEVCAVTIAGYARCWDDLPDVSNIVPQRIGKVLEVRAGADCAVTVDRKVRCWGANAKAEDKLPKTFSTALPLPPMVDKVNLAISKDGASGVITSSLTPKFGLDADVYYQWLQDGRNIEGAYSSSYNINIGDIGRNISLQVTWKTPGSPAVSTQTDSIYITSSRFKNLACGARVLPSLTVALDSSDWANTSGEPAVTGTARYTKTVQGSRGDWVVGTEFCDYWALDGKTIKAATSSSYKPVLTDADKQLVYAVVGIGPDGNALIRSSKTMVVEKAVFTKATVPTIKGKVAVWNEVSASPPSWGADVFYTYQWLKNGVPLDGKDMWGYEHSETFSSYIPRPCMDWVYPAESTWCDGDQEKALTLQICGQKRYYADLCLTSAAKYVDLNLLTVYISTRTPGYGDTVVAEHTEGFWPDFEAGAWAEYTWLVNNVPVGPPSRKVGANQHFVKYSEMFKTLKVKVAIHRVGHKTVTLISDGKYVR